MPDSPLLRLARIVADAARWIAAARQRRAPRMALEEVIHVRRNWFVGCAPELLITRAEDGALEIEGYAIMPVELYVRLTEGRTC